MTGTRPRPLGSLSSLLTLILLALLAIGFVVAYWPTDGRVESGYMRDDIGCCLVFPLMGVVLLALMALSR